MATMEQAFEMVENLTEELGEKEARIIALEKELLEHKKKSSQDIKKLLNEKDLTLEHICYLEQCEPDDRNFIDRIIEEISAKLQTSRKYEHLSDNQRTNTLIQYLENIRDISVYTREDFISEVKDVSWETSVELERKLEEGTATDEEMLDYMDQNGYSYYAIPWSDTDFDFIEFLG
jgi:SpoVK/Ycf46/Vps4 family AAA+-type ATPase